MSDGIGVLEPYKKLYGVQPQSESCVDAHAERQTQLSTKQIWVQGVVQSHGVRVKKVRREQQRWGALAGPCQDGGEPREGAQPDQVLPRRNRRRALLSLLKCAGPEDGAAMHPALIRWVLACFR